VNKEVNIVVVVQRVDFVFAGVLEGYGLALFSLDFSNEHGLVIDEDQSFS